MDKVVNIGHNRGTDIFHHAATTFFPCWRGWTWRRDTERHDAANGMVTPDG